MRRAIASTSLRTQLLGLLSGSVVLTTSGSLILAGQYRQMLAATMLLAAIGLFVATAWVASRLAHSLQVLHDGITDVICGNWPERFPKSGAARELQELEESFGQMIAQLRMVRLQNEQSQQRLAERNRTMDRLLEFSQTIQGAGRVDQIFPTLCRFLESELKLSGVVLLSHDSDPSSAVQVRAVAPAGLLAGGAVEFDAALCPCLRQSQPRLFRGGDSPVRCTIDQYIGPCATHEAYCIPFNVGRAQLVLHMTLPAGESWIEQRRQLAQTYANTAQSSLTSLHLLVEAERQSMTDALTGLYNRRSLEQLLLREVALAERHQQPLAIVMIDMDLFKQINDAHGHAAGDHLLRSFADCVRITLRKTDLAFRYGGDEFVIALPQTSLAQAQQVVQKLRQAFATVDFSSAIAGLAAQPTLSIGLAERSAALGLLTLPALLGAADQALYDAKTSARNCVRTYQPPQAA